MTASLVFRLTGLAVGQKDLFSHIPWVGGGRDIILPKVCAARPAATNIDDCVAELPTLCLVFELLMKAIEFLALLAKLSQRKMKSDI